MDIKWYLVYTKPGFEKKVSDTLSRKKMENYNPSNSLSKKGIGNKKTHHPILFKGYVFIRTNVLLLSELKKINGIVNIVFWMGKPVCVKNVEIKAMKLFLHEYPNVTIEKTAIEPDNSVTGGIANIEQEAPMITIKNKKAYIALPSLGYIMSAEIETANVRIISSEDGLNIANLNPKKLFNKVSEFNNSLKNYWAKALIVPISVLLLVS